MKKIYTAPSVEMTAFENQANIATAFKSAITVKSSLTDATTDLSQDF